MAWLMMLLLLPLLIWLASILLHAWRARNIDRHWQSALQEEKQRHPF